MVKTTLEALEIVPPVKQIGPWDGCNLRVKDDSFNTRAHRRNVSLTNYLVAHFNLERRLQRIGKNALKTYQDYIRGSDDNDQLQSFKHNVIDTSLRHASRELEQKKNRQQKIQQNRSLPSTTPP